MKKGIALILTAVLMGLLCLGASASDIPDLSRTASVSVEMTYMGSPVSGGSLSAYRVAEISVENGADYSFSYLEAYSGCTADISYPDNKELADELVLFIKENDISGITLAIDKNGKVVFDNLELGLYVFVQNEAADGYTKLGAFTVSVPQSSADGYVYDVDATPKISTKLETVESEPTTTEKPTPPPTTDDKLPQTGMLKWPIPILCVSGALFVVLGMYFLTESKKNYGKK